jgi:F0F1-type ATP synthase beta subunit
MAIHQRGHKRIIAKCLLRGRKQFTGKKGVYTKIADTLRSFDDICDGRADDLPVAGNRGFANYPLGG